MSTTALPTLNQGLQLRAAGGKATTLARLTAAGLPVPAGIVVPVDHPDDLLADAVAELLAHLPAPYGLVARSSAAAEDGAGASFAGLYTSRFCPADPDALLEALLAVRASARNPAITTYGQALGTTAGLQTAVLVQPALRPACSGVLAASVTDGSCTRWRIEAVHGLAGALVSGAQAGETHTSDSGHHAPARSANQSLIQLPGTPAELGLPPGEWIDLDQDRGIRAKVQTSRGGVLHLYTPTALADLPVLTTAAREQLLANAALAAAALALEHIDIEWAIGFDGALQLVQARPLTAPLINRTTATMAQPTGPQVLRGIAAAPGTGTGAAIHAPATTDVRGSVLICDALGPEAVPTLLAGPAAVVAASGGELSHTAIITRELGIPCVTNVTDALTAIAPGTVIAVDGGTGIIQVTPAIPNPRAVPMCSLAHVAVLTRSMDGSAVDDGRASTVLWHDPQDPAPGLAAFGTRGTHPVGILLPGSLPIPVTVPPGAHPIRLPGLGTLLWPQDAPPPPADIAVLGPDGQILHRRGLNRDTR